ncbi:hypothetical protein [Halomonas marinisediminis]|uniref:Uncharacterized protein n=1 Tax=Halomonas marinisediminis TaxID=2546095 RepID=A0ABY2DBE8_9GAMM|nr:hypothetical protein [Halomonas marinisediminis]TDB05396.1 hypothetical protein E0702_00020 [Halomonas marinisediminis]
MAYVLVMGGLALSVSFTLGWALWRLVRGALGWLGGSSSGGTKIKPKARKPATRKPASKAPAKSSAAKSSASRPSNAKSAAPRKAATQQPARPCEPWGLTRWLAANRSLLPLSSLALMLYAFGRLVVFGLQHRPVEAPASFAQVVMVIGWVAAGLLGLALVSLLARWRCRE